MVFPEHLIEKFGVDCTLWTVAGVVNEYKELDYGLSTLTPNSIKCYIVREEGQWARRVEAGMIDQPLITAFFKPDAKVEWTGVAEQPIIRFEEGQHNGQYWKVTSVVKNPFTGHYRCTLIPELEISGVLDA